MRQTHSAYGTHAQTDGDTEKLTVSSNRHFDALFSFTVILVELPAPE